MAKKTKSLALLDATENTVEAVENKLMSMIEEKKFDINPNYSMSNALKSAWLILQETEDKAGKNALEVCTKDSVYNALLDMIFQNLSPAKKQCYFIVRGKKLCCDKSYFGAVAATKAAVPNIVDVFANTINKGDTFKFEKSLETGLTKITVHETSLENLDNDIIAAYAIVVREGKPNYIEIMTMKQIKSAWNMGAMKGDSKAHRNFASEMAKKTVINRAVKMFLNSSSDANSLVVESFNRSNDDEYEIVDDPKEEKKEQANSKPLDFKKEDVVEIEVEEVEQETPFANLEDDDEAPDWTK